MHFSLQKLKYSTTKIEKDITYISFLFAIFKCVEVKVSNGVHASIRTEIMKHKKSTLSVMKLPIVIGKIRLNNFSENSSENNTDEKASAYAQ